MTSQTEQRIVTPQEAQIYTDRDPRSAAVYPVDEAALVRALAHTVATEAERTRAARRDAWRDGWRDGWVAAGGSLAELEAHAEDLAAKRAIENGANW